jgi:hypothetical protein
VSAGADPEASEFVPTGQNNKRGGSPTDYGPKAKRTIKAPKEYEGRSLKELRNFRIDCSIAFLQALGSFYQDIQKVT